MKRFLICTALAALALGAGSARAEVVNNAFISFTSARSQDCTGDIVEFSGVAHLVAREYADGSFGGHINWQGVTGTAAVSGVTYHLASADNFNVDFAAGDVHVTNLIRLVSQGSEDNLLVTVVTHVTTNANGEVTAEISELRSVCTG